MPRVKLRGIYATALTQLLDDVATIVQPSAPISKRFSQDYPHEPCDVSVTMTPDREGVQVTGTQTGVDTIQEHIDDIGIDTFTWPAALPRSAIRRGTVKETRGRGAIIEIKSIEGFLPYNNSSQYITENDEITVQVHEPHPPWSNHRPVLGTTITVFGELLHLEQADGHSTANVPDEADAQELVRMTDMLPVDIPEEWKVTWQPPAIDADTTTRTAALENAIHAIESLTQETESNPERTHWVWFGRTSKFKLDEYRKTVTPTIPGHHRIKTSTDTASTAVDFAEQLPGLPNEFPLDTVFHVFGPTIGDSMRLLHGKPAGDRYALGEGTITDIDGATVTLTREMTAGGTYDGLGVPRERGDTATTKLREDRWWYPTVYRDDTGTLKGTYVNVCTPVELYPDRAVYMDLHVDIIKYPDGTVERLDDDELDTAEKTGNIAAPLAKKARSIATSLTQALA